MDFIEKYMDEKEYESVHKNLQDSLVNNAAQVIQVGSIGDFDAENIHSHGYYMVEFISSLFTLQENKTINGKIFDSSVLL